jgi:2'-hydroxyisoflavone reductase
MRLLVLGGTVFLGPHLVDAARARGHSVTVVHRGLHGADLPADVERLTGDRTRADDLAAVASRGPWDAVVDTCGYVPRVVRDSGRALRDAVGSYVFVSSISAHAEPFSAADEDAPLAPPVASGVETVTGETYGPLKAACEAAAHDVFGDRALVVRPGLIVGPRDPTDRYTYWVRRLTRGGAVLAPGDGSRLVQYVDARDLAAFVVTLLERGRGGTWNVTGRPQRFDAFLSAVAQAVGATPDLRWTPEDALLARGAQPWMEVPLWIGPQDQTTGIARALADGLALRDPVGTARATWEWDRTRDASRPLSAGMTPEREATLLAPAAPLP